MAFTRLSTRFSDACDKKKYSHPLPTIAKINNTSGWRNSRSSKTVSRQLARSLRKVFRAAFHLPEDCQVLTGISLHRRRIIIHRQPHGQPADQIAFKGQHAQHHHAHVIVGAALVELDGVRQERIGEFL